MTKDEALAKIDEYESLKPEYDLACEILKNDFIENSTEQKTNLGTPEGRHVLLEKKEAYSQIRVNTAFIKANYPIEDNGNADFYKETQYPSSVSLKVIDED